MYVVDGVHMRVNAGDGLKYLALLDFSTDVRTQIKDLNSASQSSFKAIYN